MKPSKAKGSGHGNRRGAPTLERLEDRILLNGAVPAFFDGDIDLDTGTGTGPDGVTRFVGDDAWDLSGQSVSSAGDVNGDGYEDFLIGAHQANPAGGAGAGETFLVFGHGGAWADTDFNDAFPSTTAIRIFGDDENDDSGFAVSWAGDVNGDGYEDFLIGAPEADPAGGAGAGETYLVFGHGGPWADIDFNGAVPSTTAIRIFGDDEGDNSGVSVSTAGDVNDDGYDDFLIGANHAEQPGGTWAGETYLVFGHAGAWADIDFNGAVPAATAIRILGDDGLDGSGVSVSSAGDVNGDWYDDFLIGADGADGPGGLDTGESYLVFGHDGAWANIDLSGAAPATTAVRIFGDDIFDNSGHSVSSAGDVNGDGHGDFMIGAYHANPAGGADAGETYLVFGHGDPWADIDFDGAVAPGTAIRIFGDDASDRSGTSISWAGDVNNDGYSDLLIGAPGADPGGGADAGETYLVFGHTGTWSNMEFNSGVAPPAAIRIFGDDASDVSGRTVSQAGDVNNDGFGDLLIGARDADPPARSDAGETFLVFGRAVRALGDRTDVAAGDEPGNLASEDLDGDGRRDLVVVNTADNDISVYYGQAGGGFGGRMDYAVGGSPRDVAIADFNGDTRLDLAVANFADNDASILWGLASGGFGSRQDYAVGAGPVGIVAGDFNGDTRPDLATANETGGTVTALYKSATGGYFTGRQDIAVGSGPSDLATADFNVDTRPDLAVSNSNDGDVSVLWGLAGGGFGSRQDYAVGAGPGAIVAGNFNGDGRPDIAVTHQPGNSVTVLYKLETGGYFGYPLNVGVGASPGGLAAQDFNGDGRLDLAVANTGDDDVSVLWGRTGGGVGGRQDFAAGDGPGGIVAGDFDGDPWPDVAVANRLDDDVSVLSGGPGGMPEAGGYDVGHRPRDLVTADFNGDGRPDLAVVNRDHDDISVLYGQAGGSLGGRNDYAVGTTPHDIASADFNGDGRLDLAVANFDDNDVSILWGLASGGFGSRQDYAVGTGPTGIVVGDFNGDLRPDVATANNTSNTVTVLLKNPIGGYFGRRRDVAVGGHPSGLVAGDFNNDGHNDLAAVNFDDADVSVLYGLEGGYVGSRQDYGAGSGPIQVASADFNDDGFPDLVVSNNTSNTVTVLLKNPIAGYFGRRQDFSVGSQPMGLVAADLDRDNRPDVAVSNFNDEDVSVLYGQAGGGLGDRQDVAVFESTVGIVAADFNGNGWLDLALASLPENTVRLVYGGLGRTLEAPEGLSAGVVRPGGTGGGRGEGTVEFGAIYAMRANQTARDTFAAARIGMIETIGDPFLRTSRAVGRSPFGRGRTSDHIWDALSRIGLIRAVDADIGVLSEEVS